MGIFFTQSKIFCSNTFAQQEPFKNYCPVFITGEEAIIKLVSHQSTGFHRKCLITLKNLL